MGFIYHSPLLRGVFLAQMSEFERSYSHVLLYPPQPAAMLDFAGRQVNFTSKMYGFYLEDNRATVERGASVSESFLVWHRAREYDSEKGCARYRVARVRKRKSVTERVEVGWVVNCCSVFLSARCLVEWSCFPCYASHCFQQALLPSCRRRLW